MVVTTIRGSIYLKIKQTKNKMPIIKLSGGRYKYGEGGKVYSGTHAREKARKQGQVIEISKLRAEGRVVERGGEIYVKGSSSKRGHRREL